MVSMANICNLNGILKNCLKNTSQLVCLEVKRHTVALIVFQVAHLILSAVNRSLILFIDSSNRSSLTRETWLHRVLMLQQGV